MKQGATPPRRRPDGRGGAIGIDIVEIKRLEKVSKRWGGAFLKRVYTEREISYAKSKKFPAQHFAARFAAKEALFKALGEIGSEPVGWRELEIVNTPTGKPVVHWHGKAERVRKKLGLKGAVVSLSHTDHYAVASAMLVYSR